MQRGRKDQRKVRRARKARREKETRRERRRKIQQSSTFLTASTFSFALQADKSVESLYSELVSFGIVKKCLPVKMEDYLGVFNFLGATFERAGSIPNPSMAQIRQILTEYCVLPLGCSSVHSK